MKPAREPASSRPKPCASLKKSHESCPFAAPCGPRRKKNDHGQRSAFPSETSRFALMYVCMDGWMQRRMDQPDKVANPARGQLNREI